MMIGGATPSEFTTHSQNQQNNQAIGRLSNWGSRSGVGTTGGGMNFNSFNSMNSAKPSNLPDMIKALMAKKVV